MNKTDPEIAVPNQHVWLFRFSTKTWAQSGLLNSSLPELRQIDFVPIPIGTGKFMFMNSGHIRELNFRTNTVRFLPEPYSAIIVPLAGFIAAASGSIHYVQIVKLHDIMSYQPDGYDGKLVSFPVAGYLSSRVFREEKIWENSGLMVDSAGLFSLFVLVSVGGVMFYFRQKKRARSIVLPEKKFRVVEHGLFYGEAFHGFEPDQVMLLRYLLSAEDEVQTGELVDLIKQHQLDYTQKLRLKNHLIDSTNLKLRAIMNSAVDPIRVTRSRHDRRIRIYSIDKRLFE